MPAKNPPTGTDANLNLATLGDLFTNEDAARAFIESRVWPDGPICPHCRGRNIYKLEGRPGSKAPVRKGVYKCAKCRQQFTVRIGTIFEDSKLPFTKWLMTIHLMTSSKKGISSLQISRELGITVKSAWFMTHRIREAMRQDGPLDPLDGTVEVDETYVGGKPRRSGHPVEKPKLGPKDRRYAKPASANYGRGTKKAAVMVLVERDGNARCMPVPRVSSKELGNQVEVHVAKDALLMTDDFLSYAPIGRKHEGGHEVIKHSSKVYSRKREDGLSVNTNTAESFFALLKRGHYGTFHQLSKKHLFRYCNEFSFRWDHRKVTDGERMTAAIKGVVGKRLVYRRPDFVTEAG